MYYYPREKNGESLHRMPKSMYVTFHEINMHQPSENPTTCTASNTQLL